MNPAGVLAGLDEKPGREAVVVVLVGRESELQRVDPVRERCGSLPIRLQRGIDSTGLIVRLASGIFGEERAGEGVAGGATQATPGKDIGLRVIEVPAAHQVVEPRVV